MIHGVYFAHQANANIDKGFDRNYQFLVGKAIEYTLKISIMKYLQWEINYDRLIEESQGHVSRLKGMNNR